MAETNDLVAHSRSINPAPKSIHLLNGSRFGGRYGFVTNQPYKIPKATWDAMKDDPQLFEPLVQWYVNDHYTNQLPRILELERYYQADNNIHYWLSNKRRNHADNRIAGGLPHYITNIQTGYEFGTPLKFGYTNQQDKADDGQPILDALDKFNQQSDEPYHEKVMGKNLCNTGRSYELLYVPKDSTDPQMAPIDPNSAFVVWSTDIDPVELFGVRYYVVNVMDQTNYMVEVYTDSQVFYFTAGDQPNSDWTLTQQVPHYFQAVPLTEFELNEERMGLWERKLDEIDGYDQSLSEMANSQEDFSNAMLMINGEVRNNSGKVEAMTGPNGKPIYIDNLTHGYTDQLKDKGGNSNPPVLVKKILDTKANVIYLKPFVYEQPNGTKAVSNTSASYLTKALDANEWQIYINQLLQDIHKDTNTPDTSDQNFAANASGVAMAYKLWGADQEMAMSETLYQRGLRRRLRMLALYWSLQASKTGVKVTDEQNPADNVKVTFTPNLPKNNQEIMTIAQGLVTSGTESKQTIRQTLAEVTGIPADQEAQRVEDEQKANSDQQTNDIATAIQKLHANGDQNNDSDDQNNNDPTDDSNNNGGDNNGDSQTGQKPDQKAGQPGQQKQPNN